jgi:hypothetical protein
MVDGVDDALAVLIRRRAEELRVQQDRASLLELVL